MKKQNILFAGGVVVENQYFVEELPTIKQVSLSKRKAEKTVTSKILNAASMLGSSHTINISSCVGNDVNGNFCLDKIKKKGFKTEFISKSKQNETDQAIIVTDKQGHSLMTIFLGANADNNQVPNLDNFDFCYLSTSLPLKTLYTILKQKPEATPSLIDIPNKQQELDLTCLQHVDFVTANRSEAELLTHLDINTVDQAFAAAANLLTHDRQTIILTLDKDGCVILNRKTKKYLQAKLAKRKDDTGAGDIFRGLFLDEYLKSKKIVASAQEALNWATESVKIKGVKKSIEEINKRRQN
ncbi:MAG: PfkB family carbohydrate kinase [Patescibacteria group bacterium]|nr:PfkB family carbohydrate kinase [Patescibacteria group bacterium]